MIDIGAAATRKLGPLPTWAWAGVVGVGALAYRALRGDGASGASAGAGRAQTVGGDGASFGYGDVPDLSYGGGGGVSPSETTTVGGDTLPGVIGQVSSAFTLQQLLNDALAKLSTLLGQRSTAQSNVNTTLTAVNKNLDDYRDGKISKATYTSRNTALQSKLTTYKGQVTTLNTQIADQNSVITDLKAKLAAIFAAPAAAA